MAKQIARLLKTNMMADIDMPALAQFLQSQGRKGDSVLAHINPKEAMLLQKMGGAGTENPATGLPEFFDVTGFDSYDNAFNRIPDADINDIVDQARFDRSRNRQPVNTYKETEPNIDIFRQEYSQPRQAPQTIRDFPLDQNFQQDPSIPERSAGVYQRLTGRERPEDLMQMSPVPRVYDAATGNRFTMEDPYSRALSTFTEPQTVNTDYLNAINLAGSGRFSQVPELPQISPEIDTELATTTPELAPEDNRNVLRRGIDYLKEVTGLSGEELARLGLAGGLGIQGAISARRMAEQGQEARREQEAIAAPYRERGAALLAQAEGGQLTPQAQQSLQAMRARLQQGAESRGGVGTQQAAAQVEAFRQQLLANQFDYGMKISNIGDQIAMGAIRTGLEADRYASQMTSSYFNNMARLLAGMGGEEESPVTQQAQVRGAR